LLRKAFDLLFRSGHRTAEAIRLAKKEFKGQADVAKMLAFMEGTKRGISRAVSLDSQREFDQQV
jgi:UDP-N-acetylglucosamine acyltransferase